MGRRWRVEGIAGDRWVVTGGLPPGASRAVLVACTGDEEEAQCTAGAWEAVVERRLHAEPVARFEDATGNVVRPPVPASSAREPVDVEDEPCFACGGSEWERLDEGQEPVLACTRCGHAETIGVWYAGEDDEPVDPADVPPRPRFDLGEVTFPVYALEGTKPTVTGWGRGPDEIRAVRVGHGEIEVETEQRAWEETETRARRELLPLLLHSRDPWPERSIPGLVLWARRREREAQVRVAEAERLSLDVPVDGAPVRFEGLRAGSGWAIVGTVGGSQVTAAGSGGSPERVRLRALSA
jgi:hypothetical protein